MATRVVRQPAFLVRRKGLHPPSEGSDKLSLAKLLLPIVAITILLATVRIYQQAFGFETGLDATTPQFARYWYPWLAFNLIGVGGGLLLWSIWMAKTRCKKCVHQFRTGGRIEPAHEQSHLWSFACIVVTTAVYLLLSSMLFEVDAAWHQSVLRDTSLTPIHIFLFWLNLPLQLGLVVGSFVYGRTRIPSIWGAKKGIPLPYIILAAGVMYAMLLASLNEFGHSLWVFEERFSDRLHTPFLAYVACWAVFIPLARQAIDRSAELTAEASKLTGAEFESGTPAGAAVRAVS